MKLNEMLGQVRLTCRRRRLSWQTEQCYTGWIARFARHVAAQTITSPLDALPQVANVVPFEGDAAGRSARAPVGRRAA